ncbi:MAG: hypothetical protein V8S33_14740 [Intestinibacter bartlettii]
MTVSSTKIENRGLNTLENIIDDHDTMEYSFNSCDKEMSWDGYIWIFKGDSSNKKSYDDKVPVQIKGHIDRTNKYIYKKKITYKVYLEDLNVYFQDRGVLYFEIFMSEDGKKEKYFMRLYTHLK